MLTICFILFAFIVGAVGGFLIGYKNAKSQTLEKVKDVIQQVKDLKK